VGLMMLSRCRPNWRRSLELGILATLGDNLEDELAGAPERGTWGLVLILPEDCRCCVGEPAQLKPIAPQNRETVSCGLTRLDH
jgi:hypothetical protein